MLQHGKQQTIQPGNKTNKRETEISVRGAATVCRRGDASLLELLTVYSALKGGKNMTTETKRA